MFVVLQCSGCFIKFIAILKTFVICHDKRFGKTNLPVLFNGCASKHESDVMPSHCYRNVEEIPVQRKQKTGCI